MWTGAQKPAVPTFHNHHKGSYARPRRVGSAPPGGRGARPSSGPRRDVADLEDALRERGLTQYARKFVHDQGFTSVAALLRLRPAKLEPGGARARSDLRASSRAAQLRLLQPAAGAVYHARHGLDGVPTKQPRTLPGGTSAAAARIAAALADELHLTVT